MKKALIIANMMFASATVFGMVPNDGRCDQQIGNHSNMKNMKDISPAKKIGSLWAEIIDGYEKFFNTINEDGNNPMQVAKKKEELKIKLDKALKTSQSGLKHNKWVQEEVKQILSQITSEDIWEYIKKSHISSSSREDSYEIEKSAKKKAKDFFCLSLAGKNFNRYTETKKSEGNLYNELADQYAEDQELREYLLNIALEEIDSADCIWCPHPANSFSNKSGIKCYYRNEDDLILHLVHETAHTLGWTYRLREELGQSEALEIFKNRNSLNHSNTIEMVMPKDQQKEYVSIFFETLLVTDYFRESLEHNCSQKFRIWDFFKILLESDLISELADSYDENALLYGLIINGHTDQISKLKKNDKIGLHIDIHQELGGILTGRQFDKSMEEVWENLLTKLDNKRISDKNCLELRRWLDNLEKGNCSFHKNWYIKGDIFTFYRDSKEIKKSFPTCDSFDWKPICNWIKNKREEKLSLMSLSRDSIKKSIMDRLESINERRYIESLFTDLDAQNYKELSQLLRDTLEGRSKLINHEPDKYVLTAFVFLKNQQEKFVKLPDLDGVDYWLEIRNLLENYSCLGKEYWFNPFVKSAVNFVTGNSYGYPNEEHVLGIHNAFKIFKENDYEQMLRRGKPLPAGKLMKELTKPDLAWKRESIEKFYKFLNKGRFISSEQITKTITRLNNIKEDEIESMNEDEIKSIKNLEQFKPLDITKESAEEFMEFLRR